MKSLNAMTGIRRAMTAISFLLVLYTAGVVLAGSLFIVHSGEASSFLQSIPHAPRNPWTVFAVCFGLCAGLTWLVLNVSRPNKSGVLLLAGFKILLACLIIWNLNLSCRSLLLLVFSDILYTMRDFSLKPMVTMGSVLTILYLLCSYEVITPMIPMVSTEVYFNVFEHSTSSLLSFGLSVLESANLLLFIAFMCVFLLDMHQEKQNIEQELNMVHRVNEDLKHYAAMTEQIAETRERKRLAREIHDTLGHALTGIAAGMDATLAIMDKNPDQARKQLHLVRQVVSEGIGDVRASLQKLRPGALEQRGLKGALEKMIGEFESVTGMDIALEYQAESLDFDKYKEDVCFRLVQESITNARRHGGATKVSVSFVIRQDILTICIRDNGTGSETIQYGYGLTQMEESVSSIGGRIRFDGSSGFVTEAKIPLGKGEYKDECDPR